MNLVLIGYRGTGKSAIGRILAKRLNMHLVSLDEEIVKKAGKPIPKIVDESGWEHFRDIESKVTKEFSQKDKIIIDCGGGVILRKENRDSLKNNSIVFFLDSTIENIAKRIKHDYNRPSLTGKSFIEEIEGVLKERTPLYLETKDYIIESNEQTVEEVAEEIIEKWLEAQSEKN